MLVNPYAYSGIDQDVKTFLTVTNITGTTEKNALKYLVKELKRRDLWTKLKAIYPMVGGSAFTHKFNLKDPRDLDVAFRLTYYGGWTHSSNGALANGSNAYANSFFNPSTDVTPTSFCLGFYSRTNSLAGVQVDIGSYNSGTDRTAQLAAYYAGKTLCQPNSQGAVIQIAGTRADGFFMGSRTGNPTAYLQRGVNQYSANETTGAPNNVIYLGARNSTGTVQYYSAKQFAFAFLGDGLSQQDGLYLNEIVLEYQTMLGRQV